MDRVLGLPTSAPPSEEGKGLDSVCHLGLHSMASAPWDMWIQTKEGKVAAQHLQSQDATGCAEEATQVTVEKLRSIRQRLD